VRHVHAGRKRIPPEIAARLAEHLGDELLTERELGVLRHVATGTRNRDIGARLFISRNTVKSEAVAIYRKLSAASRTEAIERAIELGLVDEAVAARPVDFTRTG